MKLCCRISYFHPENLLDTHWKLDLSEKGQKKKTGDGRRQNELHTASGQATSHLGKHSGSPCDRLAPGTLPQPRGVEGGQAASPSLRKYQWLSESGSCCQLVPSPQACCGSWLQWKAGAEPSVQASNPAICDTICYLLACASVGMWSREQRDRMVSPTSDLIMRLNTWPIDVQEYLIHCRIFFINFSA